jgi:hypothetical protein
MIKIFISTNRSGKMSESKIVEIQWGGYYLSHEKDENGQYGLYRLLDFNRYAYHAALFTEKFDAKPSASEVSDLRPFIGHAPMDAKGLLIRDSELICSKPLTLADFEGYRMYLEHHEMPEQEIDGLLKSLIEFSQKPPLKLKIWAVDEGLEIEEV